MYARLAQKLLRPASRPALQACRRAFSTGTVVHEAPMKPLMSFMKLPAGYSFVFALSGAYVYWDIGNLEKEMSEDDRAHVRSILSKFTGAGPKELVKKIKAHRKDFFAAGSEGMDKEQIAAFLEKECNLEVNGETVIKAFDLNLTGRVSYSEFVSGVLIYLSETKHCQKGDDTLLKLNFEVLDTDQSGSADRAEIKYWLELAKQMGMTSNYLDGDTELAVAKIFDTFDKKGTGSLRYDEFSRMYLRYFS